MYPFTPSLIAFLLLLTSLVNSAVSGEIRGQIMDQKGNPLPARVYVRGSDGSWFHCRSTNDKGSAIPYEVKRFDTSWESHTTLSGHPFVAEVPAGRYRVFAERGPEYIPASVEVDATPEAAGEVTLTLRRWTNMGERSWFSGDTHVHRAVADLPNLLLAEDLNVALPLTYWVTKSHVPPSAGDKTSPREQAGGLIQIDPTHVIYPMNTEYEIFTVSGEGHTLGAIFVLNHKKPFFIGTPPVKPIATRARAQGALLDLDKHNWQWSLMLVPVMDVDLYELTNNHVWRTEFGYKAWQPVAAPPYMNTERDADGWTERGWIDFGLDTYYLLLNCGFRMRPSAGTASGVHPVPLGFGRVYVHQPDGFSYENWMKGLNDGLSFVTTGPMIDVTIDEKHGMGARLTEPKGSTHTLNISAEWPRHLAFDSLELIVNGKKTPVPLNVLQGADSSRGHATVKLDIEQTSWIAARIFTKTSDSWRKAALGSGIRFAHSSPIWIDVAGTELLPSQEGIDWLVRRMRDELKRNTGVLGSPALAEYEEALETYLAIKTKVQQHSNSN
jgi:hypothetical protein